MYAQLRLGGGLLGLLQGGQLDLVPRADEGVRHFKEAAREALGRGVADVPRVLGVVQADAEDPPGIPVQGGVLHLVLGHQAGDGLQLVLPALVVPLGEAGHLLGADQLVHLLFPGRPFGRVQGRDGQDAGTP